MNSAKFSLIILAIFGTLLFTVFVAYLQGRENSIAFYTKDLQESWAPAVKAIHHTIAIKGKVEAKGDTWKVVEGGQEYSVLDLPNYELIKGREFSGEDYQNWMIGQASEVVLGDEVTINGYVHPAKGYIVPTVIFVKR